MLDENAILKPLRDLDSFLLEYVPAIKKGLIYDFQPFRDITHYIDIQIEKALGWNHVGTMTNLLLFYLTIYMLFKVFSLYLEKRISLFLCSLAFSHPLYNLVFIEISQRKHILSYLFFLSAYYHFKKAADSKTIPKLSYLFYFGSITSHPINILAPAWFFIQDKTKNIFQKTKRYIPYGILGIAMLAGNFILYDLYHAQKVG